jgi:hypothetical protein
LNDLFSEYNETYEIMRASGHPQDVREWEKFESQYSMFDWTSSEFRRTCTPLSHIDTFRQAFANERNING